MSKSTPPKTRNKYKTNTPTTLSSFLSTPSSSSLSLSLLSPSSASNSASLMNSTSNSNINTNSNENKEKEKKLLNLAQSYGISLVALQESDLKALTSSSSSGSGSDDSHGYSQSQSQEASQTSISSNLKITKGHKSKRSKHPSSPVPGSLPVDYSESDSDESDDSSVLSTNSSSDTLNLSLPESFDDTFNFDHHHNSHHNNHHTNILSQVQTLQKTNQTLTQQLREAQQNTQTANSEISKLQLRVNDKLSTYNFADLEISDSYYNELTKINESELSMHEYLCINIYRKLNASKKSVTENRKKVDDVISEFDLYKVDAEVKMREFVKRVKIGEGDVGSLKNDLEDCYKRLKYAENKLTENKHVNNDSTEKGKLYDALEIKLSKSEKVKTELTTLVQTQQLHITETANTEKELRATTTNLEQEVKLITLNNLYLTNSNSNLTLNSQKIENDLSLRIVDLRECQLKHDELLLDLTDLKLSSNTNSSTLLQNEVYKLKKIHADEVLSIRDSTSALHNKEIDMLREGKDNAVNECSRLRDELAIIKNTIEMNTIKNTAVNQQVHDDVNEYKTKHKIDTFHISKLDITLVQAKQTNTEQTFEIEYLKTQVTLHNTNHIKQTESHKSKVEALENKLHDLNVQLSVYLANEVEVGRQINLGMDPGVTAGSLSVSRKRVLHCIELSKCNSELVSNIDSLTNECNTLRNEIAVVNETIKTYEVTLQTTSKPHRYVLNTIQTLHGDVGKLTKEKKALADEVQRWKGELERVIGGRGEALEVAEGVVREFGLSSSGFDNEEGGEEEQQQQQQQQQNQQETPLVQPITIVKHQTVSSITPISPPKSIILEHQEIGAAMDMNLNMNMSTTNTFKMDEQAGAGNDTSSSFTVKNDIYDDDDDDYEDDDDEDEDETDLSVHFTHKSK